MPINQLWGVGRDPRTIIGTKSFTVSGSLVMGDTAGQPVSVSITSNITDLPRRVISIAFSFRMVSSGFNASATNPKLSLYIDEELIISYACPQVYSAGAGFDDVIYINREVIGNAGAVRLTLSADSVVGNFYRSEANATISTVVL